MKTYQPKKEKIVRKWHQIDAEGKVLGRLSTSIVKILMGKHRVDYAPHVDMGDYVVVINAKKIKVTGNKEENKKYYSHSMYPGGFKEVSYKQLKVRFPERIIETAVKRMLPDNRLKAKRLNRLKVFKDENYLYKDKIK